MRPESLYEEVNVGGARNTCTAARRLDIRRILFTSSVAVYGFGETERDETVEPAPFNAYGRSKLAAERVFLDWCKEEDSRSLGVIRPTVVFGEDNRGNVYTLLRQIAEGPFTMIGDGSATKSMAYVENVAAFLVFASSFKEGVHLYNYVDKPDFDMNRLVATIRRQLGRSPGVGFRIPYRLGYAAGWVCDGLSALLGRPLPISRIRVRKFCSSTRFSAARALATGFAPPHDLAEALSRTVQHEFGAPSRATR